MPKRPLKSIKSGLFSRGFSLARTSMTIGAKAAGHAVGGLFAGEENRAERAKDLLISQLSTLTRELGQLKGSLMKAGQMLSMYGEHFLPPEANAVLKSLQSQSPSLGWEAIEKVLKRQLGPEKLAELEIDREPMASASLGQVHRAKILADGRVVAIKIQYPGVDKAIDSDISALRRMLSVLKFIPGGPQYDELFSEVRTMLHREVDYAQELEATLFFRARLGDDPRYIIPEPFPRYSTARVLTTSLEEGVPVDSPEVLGLSESRRNALATAALELYFRELFELKLVQTDPHFGNYKVRLGEPDRLVLLDFGAARKVPEKFLKGYRRMVRGSIDRDPEEVARGGREVGFLREGDAPEQVADFYALCALICEPFADSHEEDYDWGASDLPRRVAGLGGRLALGFKFRAPPREVVFLDRKMGGMFIFLHVLKAKIRARPILERYLAQ
jgi:predicted unusual protein kinase regulating ubiquinone biosynthesis (AarF/ABC1/UbiB family)